MKELAEVCRLIRTKGISKMTFWAWDKSCYEVSLGAPFLKYDREFYARTLEEVAQRAGDFLATLPDVEP